MNPQKWNPPCHILNGMKITIDIADMELADAMRFAKANTKRDEVLTAVLEFNRRGN